MARTLDVYLHTDLVGHLTQDDGGGMSFRYAESWLHRAGAVPLSHSLPLRAEQFGHKANRCPTGITDIAICPMKNWRPS